jgi:hypothetical protein
MRNYANAAYAEAGVGSEGLQDGGDVFVQLLLGGAQSSSSL